MLSCPPVTPSGARPAAGQSRTSAGDAIINAAQQARYEGRPLRSSRSPVQAWRLIVTHSPSMSFAGACRAEDRSLQNLVHHIYRKLSRRGADKVIMAARKQGCAFSGFLEP